jgi:hypothetical protein
VAGCALRKSKANDHARDALEAVDAFGGRLVTRHWKSSAGESITASGASRARKSAFTSQLHVPNRLSIFPMQPCEKPSKFGNALAGTRIAYA